MQGLRFMHAPVKTYNFSIPALITITKVLTPEEQGLWVSINDIDYDGVFPPVSAEAEVIQLIAENGMDWASYAPAEWMVDDDDEEDLAEEDDEGSSWDDMHQDDADDDGGFSDVRWDFDGEPLG